MTGETGNAGKMNALAPVNGKTAKASNGELIKWKAQHPFTRKRKLPALAAQKGRADIIAALIDNKIDCRPALMMAARKNDAHSLETLIKGGMNPGMNCGDSWPILAATEGQAYDSMRYLIGCGVDVNVRGSDFGRTPLLHATRANDGIAAGILMGAHADPTILQIGGNSYMGCTAPQMAQRCGFIGLQRMLEDYEKNWRGAPVQPPALPAPSLPHPATEAAGELPQGWSVIDRAGAEMAIQTIEDAAQGLCIRNVFDFRGKRLLTEFRSAGGTPSLNSARFDDIDTAFRDEARAVFERSRGRHPAKGLM
jgi:hypothetical protein